jgi:hypothetical protein
MKSVEDAKIWSEIFEQVLSEALRQSGYDGINAIVQILIPKQSDNICDCMIESNIGNDEIVDDSGHTFAEALKVSLLASEEIFKKISHEEIDNISVTMVTRDEIEDIIRKEVPSLNERIINLNEDINLN